MFGLSEQTRVLLRTGVTDGRLGIDGLRGLVGKAMRQDVLRGALYVFCNGRRNRVGCFLWDGSGFWLATKRVERATFAWPPDEAQVRQMSLAQLRLLLDGFELMSRRGWQRYEDRLPGSRSRPETIVTRDLSARCAI
ncbi:Transposase (putative), IS66 Orf2 like protein [mine drainage metagenome]|uniref:Transposase (Putative), IS66 Orf2 like protein n=1 Tax=mine drainage metagenome TaxID=410659 RepID=T0Z0X7_9ZZZZ